MDREDTHATCGKVLGVLGGMGPGATADYYRKLVEKTPAASDQDHINVLILGDPRIPDRSNAIRNNAAQEVEAALIKNAKKLERFGADALVIPCNTAHYWIDAIREAVNTTVLSMVEAVCDKVAGQSPAARTVMVFGTRGGRIADIYGGGFRRLGIKCLYPTEAVQQTIDDVIRDVKACRLPSARRKFENLMKNEASYFESSNAIILGCTELPIAAQSLKEPRFIDTSDVLADTAISWAMQSASFTPSCSS